MLHLGQGNPSYGFRLGEELTESSLVEKGCGVLMDEKLNLNQQCVLVAQKANSILDYMKEDRIHESGNREREVIVPLCSAIVRPHLEYCVQAWGAPVQEGCGAVGGGLEGGP